MGSTITKGAGLPFKGKPADRDLREHPYGPKATEEREGSGGPSPRHPAPPSESQPPHATPRQSEPDAAVSRSTSSRLIASSVE